MIIGCKLLRTDGHALNGQYHYDLSGAWNAVPGNGAYVAVEGGLAMGDERQLVYLECAEPTGARAPNGVQCFRRVRIVPPCPERITPKLRGWVACFAPGLSAEQRIALALESTPELRGRVACFAPDFSAEQRIALALESTPELRGEVARYAPGLSAEQRMALTDES
jgi:hypothetical protein